MIIKGTTHGEYAEKFPKYIFKVPVAIDFHIEFQKDLQEKKLAESFFVFPPRPKFIKDRSVKLMNYEIRINDTIAEFWAIPNEWTIAKEPNMYLMMEFDPQITPEMIERETLKFIIGKAENAR